MSRFAVLLAAIFSTITLAAGGCRSCSSCHDYDPPVANCNCDAHGTHRSGSACGCSGSACSGCSDGGCAGGSCSSCNGGSPAEGEYYGGPESGNYTEGMITE
jgi:hypothetical protein